MDLAWLFAGIVSAVGVALSIIYGRYSVSKEEPDTDRKRYRDKLKGKLEAGLELSSEDILDIARGAGVTSSTAIDTVYELYSSETDANRCAKLREIIDALHISEPFDNYPVEVKPSMVILSKVCAESQDENARNALGPIKKTIENYQQLQKGYERARSLTRYSLIVAVISFLLGVVGLFFAWRTVSAKDVERIVSENLKAFTQTKQVQPDASK